MQTVTTNWVIRTAVLGVGAVLVMYAQWPAIYDVLRNARIVPIEEPLTELYFNDSVELPTSAARPLVFSFTIRNLEGKDMVYPYVIRAEFDDGSVVELERNSISVAMNDMVRIPITTRIRPPQSARVIVEVLEKQHISFLVR